MHCQKEENSVVCKDDCSSFKTGFGILSNAMQSCKSHVSQETTSGISSNFKNCVWFNAGFFWLFLFYFCCFFPSLEPRDNSTEVVGGKPTHMSARKQQKEGKKVDIHLKPRSLHTHSSNERPHSLADLKMYKDTKILVAKFLEHSSCSLPPEVQQVVNNIKCVIKSDEKHMEEAIFSANVIDQVTWIYYG